MTDFDLNFSFVRAVFTNLTNSAVSGNCRMILDDTPGKLDAAIPLTMGEVVRINLFFFQMNHSNNSIQVTDFDAQKKAGSDSPRFL
jgi:hypothetical protein